MGSFSKHINIINEYSGGQSDGIGGITPMAERRGGEERREEKRREEKRRGEERRELNENRTKGRWME